jgi:hypothetical protein
VSHVLVDWKRNDHNQAQRTGTIGIFSFTVVYLQFAHVSHPISGHESSRKRKLVPLPSRYLPAPGLSCPNSQNHYQPKQEPIPPPSNYPFHTLTLYARRSSIRDRCTHRKSDDLLDRSVCSSISDIQEGFDTDVSSLSTLRLTRMAFRGLLLMSSIHVYGTSKKETYLSHERKS